MEFSTSFTHHLTGLLGSGLDGLGDPAAALSALDRDLRMAVPSFCGLQIRLRYSHPVVLTSFDQDVVLADVASSLRLPLAVLSPPGPDGSITLYARLPGAFVDLAADLGAPSLLDGAGPPTTLTSGVTGLVELSTINRAHGVLIAYGHPPDDVGDVFCRQAASAHLEPHAYAVQLLAVTRWIGRRKPARSGLDSPSWPTLRVL